MTAEYKFIIDTGTIVADTTDLESDVNAEYRLALGQNINLAASTPQGTLAQGETVARSSVMRNNAEVANMINPNISVGTWLDAVCAFLGVVRVRNVPTLGYNVQFSGEQGTVILAGAQVRSPAGDLFYTLADMTIGASNTVLGDIASIEYGPIALPVGSLDLVDNVPGWTNTNVLSTTNVVLGTKQSSDGQLKARRNQQLYKQGMGVSQAILANVLDVPGVTSAQVVENNNGTTGTFEGITFTIPNGIWVCVAGTASSAAVAKALYASHQGGCPWTYGGTGQGVQVGGPNGIQVTDEYSQKKYFVKYTTPVLYDVYVNLVGTRGVSAASDTAIQNIIVDYANGNTDGEAGLVVGASVSAFEIGGAVAKAFPGMYVKSCTVAVVARGAAPPLPGAYVVEFPLSPWMQGMIAFGNISVQLS